MSLSNNPAASASRTVNFLAFCLFLVVLVVAPFPYGGVLPGGTFLIQAGAFLSAALAFASRGPESRLGTAWLPVTALVLIAALGAVQLIPMRAGTLHLLSPASAKVYSDANAVLRLFDRPAIPPRISIAPTETRSTSLLTLAYAALFCAGAIVASTRRRRQIILAVLLVATVAQVLAAAAAGANAERIHGPFVNANHFAGYLEIALFFAFGLIWCEMITNAERGAHIRDRAQRLEHRVIPIVWRVLLWGVLAAGIALTRSRGGVTAAALTTVVMIALAFLHRPALGHGRRIATTVVVAVAAGVLFVAFSTGQAAILRFLAADPRDIGTDTRLQIWRASIRAWQMFPTFGSGLGTFREAFRRVQPIEIQGLVEQAHNDFLQLLVTGGWVGAALAVVAIGSMVGLLFAAWLRQPHRQESAMVLSAIGALFSLTLHGVAEFNMSIPAIPATLAAMLGMAWAAARAGPASVRDQALNVAA